LLRDFAGVGFMTYRRKADTKTDGSLIKDHQPAPSGGFLLKVMHGAALILMGFFVRPTSVPGDKPDSQATQMIQSGLSQK
jgi:hypothetical protein